MEFIAQPFGDVRLGEFLLSHFADPQWTFFRAAIAFVKRSGTQHIRQPLLSFSHHGAIRLSAGIDLYGTSREGLADLLDATPNGQIYIYRNNGPYTFHPKVYLFKSAHHADVIVGSGNLTGGGLFTNYEASLALTLDLAAEADVAFLRLIEATLDLWSQAEAGKCYLLTPEFLEQLVAAGLVRSEAQLAAMRQAVITQQQTSISQPAQQAETPPASTTPIQAPPLFATFAVPPAPNVPAAPRPLAVQAAVAAEEEAEEFVEAAVDAVPTFVISVLTVDLPVPGSSNEVTITKHIRNLQPEFWGWTEQFTGPDATTGQYRRNVRIRYGVHSVNAYLLDFPGRKPDGTKASADFRLGSIAPIVADLQQEDDLIVLSRSTEANIDYTARVVHVNEPEYENLMNGMQVYSRSRSANGTYRKFRYLQ
jgi:hypothetical protein